MTQLKGLLFHEAFPNSLPPVPPPSHEALSLPHSPLHSIKFRQWHAVISFSLVCLLYQTLIAFKVKGSSYLCFPDV